METAAKAASAKNAIEEAVDKEAAKQEKKAVEHGEYLDNYKKFTKQKDKYNIYCITGESKEVVLAPAFVEKLQKRALEGVYVAEYVNKYCLQQFKVLVSVTRKVWSSLRIRTSIVPA